jgi:hypothetical protein
MKKLLIVLVVVIAVVLLAFGAYYIFLAPKVPQAFIDRHNETAALGEEVAQVADLNSMPEWNAVSQQMKDEKYSDALKSTEIALGRKNGAAAKLSSIDSKLAEMAAIAEKISDADIKTGAKKFIEMAKKENTVRISYNNLQIQMLEKMKTMVGILVKNSKTISAADEATINSLSKQINDLKNQFTAAEKAESEIQSQYKEAEKEFFKLVNLSVAE